MISARDFASAFCAPFESAPVVAVAVSGGADSMALLLLLQQWLAPHGGRVVAVTVDHGLRPEAAREARQVKSWCRARNIEHHTLKWTGDKPVSGVLEAAREARYALLETWCRKKHILHLALAHHADDQAETLLLRFSKGSGVAGLAGMRPVHYLPHVQVVRPLLSFPKQHLIETCQYFAQPWLEDPSNYNHDYARPRLRDAATALAREGFTADSAALLAARMALAQDALDDITIKFLTQQARLVPGQQARLARGMWHNLPADIQLRTLATALQLVNPDALYIRHARLTALQQALQQPFFRGRTLAGCLIKIRGDSVMITHE